MENLKLSQVILKVRHLKNQLDYELKQLYGHQVRTKLILRDLPDPKIKDVETEKINSDYNQASTTTLMNYTYLLIQDKKNIKGFSAYNEMPIEDDLICLFENNLH